MHPLSFEPNTLHRDKKFHIARPNNDQDCTVGCGGMTGKMHIHYPLHEHRLPFHPFRVEVLNGKRPKISQTGIEPVTDG